MHRTLTRFRPNTVEHSYCGVPLRVQISDPLARGWYDHDWEPLTEVELLKSAGLREDSRVFDIGAHQGIVAMILAAHVGRGGKVVAVEALPHNARMCAANLALNGIQNVTLEPAAIADHVGELEISIDLNAHVHNRTSTISTVKVPAVTIDALADRHGQPDVLFIDVEGYECRALAGAARALSHGPDCYVEIHRDCGLEAAGGSLAEALDFFPRDRYLLRVWSDDDSRPREITGASDCPPGGRLYLVATRRER